MASVRSLSDRELMIHWAGIRGLALSNAHRDLGIARRTWMRFLGDGRVPPWVRASLEAHACLGEVAPESLAELLSSRHQP